MTLPQFATPPEWYVHYKVGDHWLVDGPYRAIEVTDTLQGHKRFNGYEDGYISNSPHRQAT